MCCQGVVCGPVPGVNCLLLVHNEISTEIESINLALAETSQHTISGLVLGMPLLFSVFHFSSIHFYYIL